MQRTATIAAAAAGLLLASQANAFEVFKDFVPSKEVYNVVFIKVDPNRMDDYLQGLQQTWWNGCEISKKMGQLEECAIYASTTASSGDFNMMLVQKFASGADLDPDEGDYNKFMTEMRKQLAEAQQDKIVEGYNEIRTFAGEQNFRKITFK
jgi:hypothetical protein